MQKSLTNPNAGFGSVAVFMTAISTILGAILFLRFGYAVAHVGLGGVIGIIIIGHIVTVPTALAVAEIATNQRVQGGGAYYIISRSFGLNIGGAIGFALYLSQAISVAFYVIAFGEAFDPLIPLLNIDLDPSTIKRIVTLFLMTILALIALLRGANIGMKALYGVVALLFVSIFFFLAGNPINGHHTIALNETVEGHDSFFFVFTIIFPAFTGMAAGLGLSGDLKDPKKSIPRGTLLATLVGMLVYVAVAIKLSVSASVEDLASDQLIMSRIAVWGPIIPIGLAAASLSSAIGSLLVAPRTLQAIGYDSILPFNNLNNWMAQGRKADNEPINGSIITIFIAYFFIVIGDVDFVAQIIAMFFMATYGAICLISFLEHFAADPSYRPTFKYNKWIFSLFGALLSFWLMFKMNWAYAALSALIMAVTYHLITIARPEKQGLEKLFKGVVFQLSRQIQIFVQRANKEEKQSHWRPFAICVSEDSFKRQSAFDMLRWICYKHGFGTYIHFIKGFLTKETHHESTKVLSRLINQSEGSKSRLYLDTIISPSYTSAIAQVIQLTGISGKGNNLILFEFSRSNPESLTYALDNYHLFQATGFDVCVLNSSYKGFGYRREIHVWITAKDFRNANLMILLAYIISGHPDWRNAVIKIFATFPQSQVEKQRARLLELIQGGRLPISPSNVSFLALEENQTIQEAIVKHSSDADLTIAGFTPDQVKEDQSRLIEYGDLGNVLFVNTFIKKDIE
ncbi:APC family permease [Carboxylicivirga linearis]|uniref:Amino acid permease n=1 Tax=Carboxylicivirga linearis TaxID=1628157 RepID=A0ABS5JQB3_9BACT|nr:amino acid permease [Carboxylicivirga linearis]MBS2097007.1 amino acid permease [Carboxylicivirga linearis]